MTSTVLNSLVSQIRHAATLTRCLLQRNYTPASTVARSLSTLPSAASSGGKVSDTRADFSKRAGSLFTFGSQSHPAVLVSGFTPGALQVRWYESAVRPRLKCQGCYFVWRHGRKFVECSDHPRHKQMKAVATRKVWAEDYSKGDIQKAADWYRRFPREFLRTADRKMVAHNWLAGTLGKEV
ncbi:unnamed protein product [Candidula unifasciata]|uniref:Large ribosomal subunit protein bL36m n=1 Tax=Candidula unifasciata TaxID=100452 RepID=A0A8S3Z8Q2_9EUPU|nr:unnamed protein product [Candidula unifasciata]